MINRIIAVVIALSVLITIAMTAPTNNPCASARSTQVVVQAMTASTTALTAHDHVPSNHNWQEYALLSRKTYKIENPADYMEGLTAYSKRSIYVGEAASSPSVKLSI